MDLSNLSVRTGGGQGGCVNPAAASSLHRCRHPPGPDQLENIGNPLPPAVTITTDKLRERIESNRAGWNNWANPARLGRVRFAPQAVSREW